IIGEATKQISQDIKRRHPEVPWKEMAGMRDKLIHAYLGINYTLVWDTAKQIIPEIKPLISEIAKKKTL
ncbi:MAG: HepT-like ribonuclease domain-containing protein, partial [Candidatus Omnitrophota bacterium]